MNYLVIDTGTTNYRVRLFYDKRLQRLRNINEPALYRNFTFTDFQAFTHMISARTSQVIMYGKTLFAKLFSHILKERYPHLKTVIIPEQQSKLLSAIGAINIYKAFLNKKGVKIFNV